MTVVGLFLASWLSVGGLDVSAGSPDAELQRIERAFPARPRAESERALERLVVRWPETEAASRSRLWLGSLALTNGRDPSRFDRAATWFDEAARRPLPPELATLAERGRGDAEAGRGRWRSAAAHYETALGTSSGLLGVELVAKRATALREVRRAAWALACELFAAALTAWLLVGLVRAGRAAWSWPVEVTFLAPVYGVLFAVAWLQDPGVGRAVGTVTLASVLWVGLTFAPARARVRMLVDALLTLVATAAMLYVALHRAGLLDLLWARLTHSNA